MWTLDIRPEDNQANWDHLVERRDPVHNDVLVALDFGGLQNGTYTLRLRIEGANDGFAEKAIRIVVSLPLPSTPIPPTATATATPTATLPPPPTELPSDTPTPTPSSTDEPPPTETETPPGP